MMKYLELREETDARIRDLRRAYFREKWLQQQRVTRRARERHRKKAWWLRKKLARTINRFLDAVGGV